MEAAAPASLPESQPAAVITAQGLAWTTALTRDGKIPASVPQGPNQARTVSYLIVSDAVVVGSDAQQVAEGEASVIDHNWAITLKALKVPQHTCKHW